MPAGEGVGVWSHVCLCKSLLLRVFKTRMFHVSETSSLDFACKCFDEHKFLVSIFKNFSILYLEGRLG